MKFFYLVQRCPEWKKDHRLHLYVHNVDHWISRHLRWANASNLRDVVFAAATLIHFPGFQDVHGIIFKVLGSYTPYRYTYDSQEWETYFKYRQLISEFLMDQERSGTLFVQPAHYLKLAKHFWLFLMTGTISPDAFIIAKSE